MPTLIRGCGVRQQGGLYAVCATSPGGRPLEEWLVDPPIPVVPSALGITPRGVRLVEVAGVWHILDWIGSMHYAKPADFVEEVRRFGASRRLPRTLDFSKLTPDSRLVLVHADAYIAHPEMHYAELDALNCPKRLPEHRGLMPWTDPVPAHPKIPPCCAGLWYEDIEPADGDLVAGDRRVLRRMPSFSYEARTVPPGLDPSRFPAVFMRLPITGLTVVRADDGHHEATMHAAEQARLPVTLEDE